MITYGTCESQPCCVGLGVSPKGIVECSTQERAGVDLGSTVQSPAPTRSMTKNEKVTPSAPTDESLVLATINGDKGAYRVLVERYQGRLLAMTSEILGTREDAEDVVQESFVKAFLSLSRFKGESSFFTWIYRITYNMAIDVKRRNARRGGTHVEYKESSNVKETGDSGSSTPTLVPALNETSHDPHEVLAQKEAGAAIRSVLSTLSDEHREVVLLREVDGLNYDQISEAVGIPKGTVMSRLHYARKMLQKALKDFAPSSREPLTSAEEGLNTHGSPRNIFHSVK